MIGNRHIVGATRNWGLLSIVCLCSGFFLSACTDFKRAIGIEKTSPDEFAVESRAPLTLPPDFDLRPPQPGASRPQERSAADKARGVVDNAGPGEPGKQEPGALRFPGVGPGAEHPPGETQQAADQGLSNKLLQYNDTSAAAAVESHETTALKGVY